jgi:2-polyprenyl-3-methyl-5-hydroxy-6-metoxy-1,4-benzoquinol methylase
VKPVRIKDFLVSEEFFNLKYDARMGAWQTTPELTTEALQKYYPKEEYLSHVDKANSLKAQIYLWVKKKNIQTKLNWISKTNKPGKLLDYGAGNGTFAQAAIAKGWDVFAVEYSEAAKKVLARKGIRQMDNTLPKQRFDAITLWHVFEHLPNPRQQIKRFYEALAPGGILVLAIPNHNSWDAKHYSSYWAAYDVPRHLWHYNSTSITRLAHEAGFHVLKTHNMFWDAFYVALLSEQYRKASFAWPKAFFKGLYSNFVGWRKNNTSSLTFILQKRK